MKRCLAGVILCVLALAPVAHAQDAAPPPAMDDAPKPPATEPGANDASPPADAQPSDPIVLGGAEEPAFVEPPSFHMDPDARPRCRYEPPPVS